MDLSISEAVEFENMDWKLLALKGFEMPGMLLYQGFQGEFRGSMIQQYYNLSVRM